MSDECRCGDVRLGTKVVGKNWNPDCPVHPWSAELQAEADRSAELQRAAMQARERLRRSAQPRDES